MNQLNVGSTYNDYMDSFHYRIVFNLDKQVQILNANTKEPILLDNQIKFGETKLEDY